MEITYKDYRFVETNGTMRVSQYQALIDILEVKKPARICELGGGQSTVIFEQYCDRHGGTLFTIESDELFFRKNTVLFSLIEHASLTIGNKTFEECNVYQGLEHWMQSQDPFDLVLIDGPFGWGFREAYRYHRVQMLSFALLDKLNDGAVIMHHDSERANAITTCQEFEKIITEKGQSFVRADVGSGMPQVPTNLTIYYLLKGDQQCPISSTSKP